MAFYNEEELQKLGFLKLGKNVKISKLASIYNFNEISVGDNSRIDDFCVLSGKIEIGRNVHIAVNCNLAAGEKGIVLKDFSGLAYGVNLFTQSDDYSGRTMTNPTIPDKFKKEKKRAILIGRHCIVGAGSYVFPGVKMATGTSVGAMSMVTHSTKEWTVYFGIPAKALKPREQKLLELEKEFLSEEFEKVNSNK